MVSSTSTMQVIPLTQNKFAKVDDADYGWLNGLKWHYHKDGYAQHSKNIGNRKIKTFKMHRLITDAPTGLVVDHINGDRLDNRRENLRVCSHYNNCQNRKTNINKRFKGVNWHKRIGRYQVSIRVDRQLKHLGYFDNEVEAAKEYNRAAIEHFGEFARLNQI